MDPRQLTNPRLHVPENAAATATSLALSSLPSSRHSSFPTAAAHADETNSDRGSEDEAPLEPPPSYEQSISTPPISAPTNPFFNHISHNPEQSRLPRQP
ncbi:hypothetical protein BGZ75_006969, partial [Mortierella antarctica]